MERKLVNRIITPSSLLFESTRNKDYYPNDGQTESPWTTAGNENLKKEESPTRL